MRETHVLHDIFIKPHEPQVPEAESHRSLFLGNVPATTTELHVQQLFHERLTAGRVEKVDFLDFDLGQLSSDPAHVSKSGKFNRKRKRATTDELDNRLNSLPLPEVWQRRLGAGGAHAVAVFVDRPSMEKGYKAVQVANKVNKEIHWGVSSDDQVPSLGLQRYLDHLDRRYPSKIALLRNVNIFMNTYSQLEEARSREEAKKRQAPDEDGFVMVTKGSRGGVLRRGEAKELADKQKEKKIGLENFYRFQTREKRKEQQGELLRKFEQDRRTVEEMKRMRGNLRPE
ncbi:MAG: hypothetical protein Q9160_000468 [Pyrenula sp. 1 TL-2023]